MPPSIRNACPIAFMLIVMITVAPALAAWETGMQEPASSIAADQQWLNIFYVMDNNHYRRYCFWRHVLRHI